MNKDELVEKVKQLSDLTNDEKAELIAGLRKKKYGLVWENHPEDVEERLRTQLPVLVEDKSKQIASNSEDAPNHILIEGDNLEALTALTYTHEGKVDVIYIDPPYNTGNKDFVYNDSYVDSEDGYRHSKWLSFMEKRLRIAKKLLSDKGVIFISIDDNEQANLKLLCDEVFGAHNYIATLVWQKKKGGGNDSKYVATEHEYVLFYSNDKSDLENIYVSYGGDYLKRYKEMDDKGRFFWDTFKRKSGKQYYAIVCPDGTILQYDENGEAISWLRSEERFKKDLAEGEVRFVKNKGTWSVHFKQRQPEGKKPRSLLVDNGTTSDGAEELLNIFKATNVFDNPKPSILVNYLLRFKNQKNITILDFFAGSGTTLHATMQLNKEDGGHRQCILVTNNENNICENVTYERNKRVINGYTTPKGEKVEGLKGNNLRYYKVDFVSRDNSLEGMRKLMGASTDLLCIKHDLYHEQHTFGNLKLRLHIARYFADETGQKMLIIYKVDAIEYFVKEIAQMPEETQIMVYVFSTNNYAMDADFEEVADRVTLCALPAAIYNAYLKVLPKKKIPVGADVDQEKPTLFNGEEDEQ